MDALQKHFETLRHNEHPSEIAERLNKNRYDDGLDRAAQYVADCVASTHKNSFYTLQLHFSDKGNAPADVNRQAGKILKDKGFVSMTTQSGESGDSWIMHTQAWLEQPTLRAELEALAKNSECKVKVVIFRSSVELAACYAYGPSSAKKSTTEAVTPPPTPARASTTATPEGQEPHKSEPFTPGNTPQKQSGVRSEDTCSTT
jgi:hypothetical protein